MPTDVPTGLLYVLTVGREKELVLRELTVSRYSDDETSTLVLNFAHVVGARIAPYSDSRSASF
jgi:hypothetical protein